LPPYFLLKYSHQNSYLILLNFMHISAGIP
jgi:hypothetical protein